jgi:beta-mannosidase
MNQLDLNGAWRMRPTDGQRGRSEFANRDQVDEARYFDATVPGEVHLDLWRQGVIADPYVGANCLSARWVEEMIWSYRRTFEAPPEAVQPGAGAGARAWLVFEQLDLVAAIVLNGVEIGRQANVFHPCRIEVTGKLRPGTNVLAVHLDGGLYHIMDKPWTGMERGLDQRLTKRTWLRKPQCQFSWDWSTRLINVGITGPVRLEWTTEPVRADQFVALADLSADLQRGRLRGRWFVEGLDAQASPSPVELTVELLEAGVSSTQTFAVKPGLAPLEVALDVPHPKLWWPIGHGESHLHTVRATLKRDGRVIATVQRRVGFRHVRVNQDPHPRKGRYFNLEVNGRKIFCKGGNFVPADMIFQRIDDARYETLVERAIEANFNFLRVWGGGLYEADRFFDLCDERGILTWQEFIFACDKFPANDETFHKSVCVEAAYQLRRLAHHASLVVWCGNNEIEVGYWHWGYDKSGQILPDHALYHLTLPRIVRVEDDTRYYQPSSPFSPDGDDPAADHTGDQHPWTVGFANTDFRDYRRMICRFANEGGILGPTSLPTMLQCLPESQRQVQSWAWQVHDNSVDSWGEPSYPDAMIQQWLGMDVRKMSVEQYTYWAGLVQGEGLREYVDNFHRRIFDSGAAVFWMYNDCWPAVRSWTIVDYALRRTPAFWPVRRAMAPVNVVLAVEGDDVVVFGINETDEAVRAELRFGVMELAGRYAMDQRQAVTLPPGASTPIARVPLSSWTDRAGQAPFALLTRSGKLVARNRLFEPLFKDLRWPRANVAVHVETGRAIFTSDTFAWGVCLDLNGEQALADNFFDVYPGVPHEVAWPWDQPPRVLHVGNLPASP